MILFILTFAAFSAVCIGLGIVAGIVEDRLEQRELKNKREKGRV